MKPLAPQIPVAVAALGLPAGAECPRIVDANDAFVRLFGHVSRAAVIGEPADPRWARALVAEPAWGELHSGRTWRQLITAGGDDDVLAVEVTAALQRDEGGAPSHLVVTCIDVTGHTRTERALRESERRLRNLAANVPGAIFRYVLHTDGTDEVAFMSEGCHAIWELTAEQIQGDATPLWQMVEPEDVVGLRASVLASADTLEPWVAEWRITTPSDRKKWLQGSGRPTRLPNGDVAWDSLILDITELKQAETARRLSEARLSSIFAESPVGLAILDRDCRYTHINPVLAAMNGALPEAHIGRRPRDILPAELAAGIERAAERILATGEPDLDHEFSGETPAQPGALRYWLSSQFPITDGRGDVAGVGFVVAETTEHKRAVAERAELEAKLLQAQRLESIGRLAGGIAHDFNNLLTVILANAEEAEMDAAPDSPQAERLREVRTAARRSAELTRQLLAFARRQVVSPRVLVVDDELQKIVDMLRRLIGEDRELVWQPRAIDGCIAIDAGQLGQVVTNLVVNARDASPERGQIVVATANVELAAPLDVQCPPGSYVRITVRDEGAGMDSATQAQMFEPFFTTKAGGLGTGLGLATVHGIVMQNRGWIDVRSSPGAGTTIDVYLPRHIGAPEVVTAPAGAPPSAHSGSVLLVEDEPAILALARRILEQLGYAVIATASANEALALGLRTDVDIDLLVTDLVMPELSGKELAARLTAARPGLRVLFLSGYFHEFTSGRGVPNDHTIFLAKPFTAADIEAKVREAFGR